jgi:pimeloyl-ACP methyl ester carboxylesterase
MRHPVIFLPGILMPAELRYAALLEALGDEVDAVVKDLEIYATSPPSPDHSLASEVAGIDRVADEAGFERFHLYGHSGGGAVVLAYVAEHQDRVLSMAVDEPASDFSLESQAAVLEQARKLQELPPSEGIAGFIDQMFRTGVARPAPPERPSPPWMADRPAGVRAFAAALGGHQVDPGRFRAFAGPVYYSHGSLSHESWDRMRDRLGSLFPHFVAELYEGLSHMRTSHVAEPDRVARALRALWLRAGHAGEATHP